MMSQRVFSHIASLTDYTRIAVDVDGVMLNFVDHWCRTLTRAFPSDGPFDADLLMRCRSTRTNPTRNGPLSTRQRSYIESVMSDPQWWKGLWQFEGASHGLDVLRALPNVKVTALTAPYKGCKGWRDVRVQRLVEEFGFNERDIVFASAGHKHEFDCDIIIEDSVENLEDIVCYAMDRRSPSRPPLQAWFIVQGDNEQQWNESFLDSFLSSEEMTQPQSRVQIHCDTSLFHAAARIALYVARPNQ